MLASSGNRGGEVGNGRAGNQGLDSRSNGGSANATGDTNEGGHVGEERRLLSETGDVCCRKTSRVLVEVVGWLFPARVMTAELFGREDGLRIDD